ncbi:MAG: recombinase family protein [Lachnospiraceae bacterium]|nr:recombinase family protein [Lachnospiraceae bacterium]
MSEAFRVGYCRVSTKEQNLERQEALMEELGVDKLFEEKVSGKQVGNRPELKKALDYVREGDIFIVSEISRLARNVRDLLEIVAVLEKKGVRFIAQKEGIDTDTPYGKYLLMIFGAMAELELDYIRERQAEGIAVAKANGKYLGRKPIDFDRKKMIKLYPDWKAGKMTARAFMKELNLQPATFYRRIREYEMSIEDIDIFADKEEVAEKKPTVSAILC